MGRGWFFIEKAAGLVRKFKGKLGVFLARSPPRSKMLITLHQAESTPTQTVIQVVYPVYP